MAQDSFIKRFQQKLEGEQAKGPTDPSEKYDEDGAKYEFSKKLPDFLDPATPEPARTKNRNSFKKYVEKLEGGVAGAAALVLIDKIYTGNTADVTPEQFEQFTGYVASFKEKWEAAKEIASRIDGPMVERMAKLSNRGKVGTYAYSYGTDVLAKIWKEKIPHLIVDDEEKFGRLQEALLEHEKAVARGDQEIREKARRFGIKEAQYEDIMKVEDHEKRRAMLRAVMNKKYEKRKGMVGKAGKFFSHLTFEAARVAKDGRERLESALQEIDAQILEVGDILADMTSDDKDVQQAVLAAIKTT